MTIRPMLLNGMIQRTDDVSFLKHQEDQKPVLDQQNIQVQMQKEQQQLNQSVTDLSESDWLDQQYDAREEGKNKYRKRDGKKNAKKTVSDGSVNKVVRKNQSGSFDMKI